MKCPCVPLTAEGRQCCAVVSSLLPSFLGSCLLLFSSPAAWLTMMILTKRMERSRLNRQIASEQSALSLCSNSASSHHLSIFVFTCGGTCVREDLAAWRGVLPYFEVLALTNAWMTAGDLKALSITGWHFSTTNMTQLDVYVLLCK